MNAITIAEDVRLDLGYTYLVGTLVFDGDGLVLVAPSGSTRSLGHHLYTRVPGDVMQAPEGAIFIEELGMSRALPAALVALGHCQEISRHRGLSSWGVDVVELRVLVPVTAVTGAATNTVSE